MIDWLPHPHQPPKESALFRHTPSSLARQPLLALLLWIWVVPALAGPVPPQTESALAQSEPVRVGVLATRGPALAKAQWQPLMGWLNERVPERRFALVPLELDALAEAVAQNRLDFVITNPGQSVSLSRQYPLAWLATLKSPAGGDNLAIGAALVVRAHAPYRH